MSPKRKLRPRPRRSSPPRVALIIETSKVYGREVLLGISKYLQLHGNWSVFTEARGQDDPDPSWLDTWEGEGIITRGPDPAVAERAFARGVPVVGVRHLFDRPPVPTVFPDQEQMGRRVAEHFLERGFRNFAYCGIDRNWSHWRCRAFFAQARAGARAGGEVSEAEFPPGELEGLQWEERLARLSEWVGTLPFPVGVMTSHDILGVELLGACRRVGARVPDEVAVVSVDNDRVLCELANPPLSSLDQDGRRVGYEAAALLDRMMAGETVAPKTFFYDPGEVVMRRSSDVVATDDPRVSAALRFIREHACERIGVDDVVRAAGLSRRTLETRFGDLLGRSPMEEIHAIQLRRIKKLLLETDYTLAHIAELTGFEYHEYLSRFFKKRTGSTPGQFRREHRRPASWTAGEA